MTENAIDTTYEPFSRRPEYIDGNRAFVEELPFRDARFVLDLACGTGAISELILQQNPDATIFGVDLSRQSLRLGHQDFQAAGLRAQEPFGLAGTDSCSRVLLIQGSADELPFRDGWADVAFMGHSIHLLPDLDRLLRGIRRVLAPGGVFAFNSSFYAGSQAPGTDRFYQLWWKEAYRYLRDRDAELVAQGLPGVKRTRGTTARSRPWISRDEWIELLQRCGFAIDRVHERTIMYNRETFETVGAYSGMAKAMASGYPVDLACEALVHAVEPAMREAGVDELPRLWLELTASRPC